MRPEHELRPERRVGLLERERREVAHDALERRRVTRHLEGLPVGLGLHPARDGVREWRAGELEHRDDEQRERNGRRCPHPSAAARRTHEEPGARDREEREPGDPLRDVMLRVVAELVGEDDALLVLRERTAQERVPDDDASRRPDPVRVRVGLVGVVADLLDANGDVSEAELRLVLARRGEQRLILQRVGGEVEVGRDEREERADRDEDRGSGQPPALAELAREAHHDDKRETDREERGRERRPALERPVEVAELRLSVVPLPPVRRERRTGGRRATRCRARASRGACPCRSGRPPTPSRTRSPGVRRARA